MKRIVVTGATSMLGIALINACIERKIYVLAVVRPESKNRNNIPFSDFVRVLESDMCSDVQIDKKYDVFYHFAWGDTDHIGRNDVQKQEKNIKMCIDAVLLAKKLGCTRFVGAGSQAEFGSTNTKVKPDFAGKPETPYAIAKLAAGNLTRILASQLNIEHIWMRIFSVYGPHDHEYTLISYLLRELEKGETPKLTKCEQEWDFLYADDAARAFLLLGEKGKSGKIYSIGSGQTQTLRQYIEQMIAVLNIDVVMNYGQLPYTENQVMYLCADIEDLCEDIGFKPEISFEQGIQRTLNWYKEKWK
jgi:UDP-glucose 4-epimerase